MASATTINSVAVVIDANVAIALCAKESDKLASALAKINEYATKGCQFYAPGVIVAECLYVFCKKLKDGVLTAAEHGDAIQAFIALMRAVNPPPSGDRGLIKRAEEIRGALGCSRSADGVYLALAEELGRVTSAEVVTFDNGMKSQATANLIGLPIVVLSTT
jgi:predicted nucleic acid-binding protein